MRYIFLALLMVSLSTSSSFGQESLQPDSLLNWLKIIDSEGFKLISACDQNGFYFAVKSDADGDIVFAKYEHEENPNATNPRSFSLQIKDENGEDLLDWDSKKKNPDSKEITYSGKKQIGPAKLYKSITITYSLGSIYPLKNRSGKGFKIQYAEKLGEDRTNVLFEQWIAKPQPKNAK